MAKKAVAVAETPEALELKKLRDFIHRADEEGGDDRLEAAPAVDVAIAWVEELQREASEAKLKYDQLFEQWADLHRQLNEQLSAAPAEVAGLVSEQDGPFVCKSVAGTVYKVRVAYDEFASLVEGDFSPWDDLPDEAKQMYADSVHHVREGGEMRTDFERVVARLLIEASPAAFE